MADQEPASPSGRALVVAVGASQCSLRALQWAVDSAARPGDHCHVGLVCRQGWGAGTSYRFHDPGAPQHELADMAAAKTFVRANVFPLLDSKSLAHDVHLSVETVDAPGSSIAEAIAKVAEEVDAALVVLGTNNVLTGEDGPDLGSTARAIMALFRQKMVAALGRDSSRDGYDAIVELTHLLNKYQTAKETQAVTRAILKSLFPPWLPAAFKVLFSRPLPGLSCQMNAYVTMLTCQWLMGPCKVNDVELDGGRIGKGHGVLVERCRYLEETKCASVCINSCKLPTQEFFREDMGLSLTMTPDYNDFSCQFSFGRVPPPEEGDEALATPCFAHGSLQHVDQDCGAKPGRASLNVAVIGAGAAGLVAARELLREGHTIAVLEQNERVGGIWDYSADVESDDLLGLDPKRRRVHSSLYADLRTNLPREVMGFSDFPNTPAALNGRSVDARRFPAHPEVQAFLEAFADEFDLRRHIRFRMRVARIDPLGPPGAWGAGPWALTAELVGRSQGSSERLQYDAVVVAVGNYAEPNLPKGVAGMRTCPVLQLHCHNFRSPAAFREQTVLVVGASFSGVEIAQLLSGAAAAVVHSARTWGPHDLEAPPATNIMRVPMLEALLANGRARFAGGSLSPRLDAVIYCTGYQYHYPFLQHLELVETDDMRVAPLYKHVFPPAAAPTLAFIGLLFKSLRNMQFELQAKWVARVLSGRAAPLPDREAMQADAAAFYALLERAGVPVRHTHCQADSTPVNQWDYNEDLRQRCGPDVPLPPPWLCPLQRLIQGRILVAPRTFRDTPTPEEAALYEEAAAACEELLRMHRRRKAAGGLLAGGPSAA
ncbi:hypothetical protein WJX81_004138 [Elliptochloris bilobata]|uniref:Flavin-containing monooxygenase n=1 Tax=Elliptochloris bilobata TaxID=381761 RepID=A0AAW1RGB1_9CHLO